MKTVFEITSETPDGEVALLVAEQLLALTDSPFRFAINHDIRPPKMAACPVNYDWTKKDRCGIEWKQRFPTKRWLVDALLHGYTVYLMDRERKTERYMESIASARRRAAFHQQTEARKASGKADPDDDIPF